MDIDVTSSERDAYLFAAKCLYTVVASLSATGVICNGILLLTAIRTKSLRSPCNILIGSCAFFDFIHQFGAFPQSGQIYTGGTINSWNCSLIQFLPEMAVAAGVFNVLSIGVDRFFSIAAPKQYRTMNISVYLFVHYLAICVFTAYNAFLMLYFYREQDLVCSIPSVFHDNAISWWAYSCLAVNIVAFVIYMRTWRLMKTKSLEADTMGRIFRTILFVTIFDLCGWAITQFINATQNLFDLPIYKRLCLSYFASLFVNLGVAMKLFIYYTTSTEYRTAIKRQLCLRRTGKVSEISNHTQS